MNSSVLYPPNSQSLSDKVIRDVVQRVNVGYYKRHDGPRQTAPNVELHPNIQHSTTDEPDKANSLSYAEIVLERRRRQCRANTARYRKKMRARAADLRIATQVLQEDIYKLELQRQLCDFGLSTKTIWDVVVEYFRLFCNAFNGSMTTQGPPQRSQHLQGHRTFLATTMSPDVITASGRGVDVLLEDYTRISLYLPDLHVELVSMHSKAEDTVLATTHVKATITERTLQLAFPHLVNDPELWTTLGSKLLDKRLVMRGSVHFIWDADIGRVVSLRSQVDFLTPMITILGDLTDVARVFEHSLINPDGTLAPQLPPMTDTA